MAIKKHTNFLSHSQRKWTPHKHKPYAFTVVFFFFLFTVSCARKRTKINFHYRNLLETR